ncbi:MAG: VCBS repeat-containing protein [Deltaproteobacteria bacterium]|nr:VCBS repeat-containing protein [Deltaproteobacteria bacterium]
MRRPLAPRWFALLLSAASGCNWVSEAEVAKALDRDGDGSPWPEDCDDSDPAQQRGCAEEAADGGEGAEGGEGTDGVDGADGADGTDGGDGSDGTDGADGADGTDGVDGADGADGGDGAVVVIFEGEQTADDAELHLSPSSGAVHGLGALAASGGASGAGLRRILIGAAGSNEAWWLELDASSGPEVALSASPNVTLTDAARLSLTVQPLGAGGEDGVLVGGFTAWGVEEGVGQLAVLPSEALRDGAALVRCADSTAGDCTAAAPGVGFGFAVIDVDGDGLAELWATERAPAGGPPILVSEGPFSPDSAELSMSPAEISGWITPLDHRSWGVWDAEDVDGDGYRDVLVTGAPESTLVFGGARGRLELTAIAGAEDSTTWTDAHGRPGGDMDGDGYADLLLPSAGNLQLVPGAALRAPRPVAYAMGLGSGPRWAWAGGIQSLAPPVDLDGDGLNDALLIDQGTDGLRICGLTGWSRAPALSWQVDGLPPGATDARIDVLQAADGARVLVGLPGAGGAGEDGPGAALIFGPTGARP